MSGPSGYIEYQQLIRTEYVARGRRLSNRECKRLARERMDLENGIVPASYEREVIQNVLRRRPACENNPTADHAIRNITQTKKNGPETHSTKNRLEAA